MKHLTPIARVSIGLAALSVLLVTLVGTVFKLFPDEIEITQRARQKSAATLAVQLVSLLEKGDAATLKRTLDALASRDQEIVSVGVRGSDGHLIAHAGDHRNQWTPPANNLSTITQIFVPISSGVEKWGAVELKYRPLASTLLGEWLNDPLVMLVILLSVPGSFATYAYLRRAMQYLDPAAVVPERVKVAFDTLTEGVLVLDAKGRVVLANDALKRVHCDAERNLTGRRAAELPWLKPALSENPASHPWAKTLAEGESQTQVPLEIPQATGEPKKVIVNAAPILDASRRVRGCIVTFDDVSALDRANAQLLHTVKDLKISQVRIARQNEELEKLANHDALTACLNRRSFMAWAKPLFEQARMNREELCCIMTDIDHFKSVNDRFGHGVGDEVIKRVATILQTTVRTTDLLCRYGGEEFCIVLSGLTLAQTFEIAERCRKEIETDIYTASQRIPELRVTSSFGIAALSMGASSLETLIEQADQALFEAKRAGRNRVHAGLSLKSVTPMINGAKTYELLLWQSLLEAIPNPAHLTGVDGCFLGFNQAWETFFSTTRECWLGKNLRDLFPAPIADRHRAEAEALIRSRSPRAYKIETPLADGSMRDTLYQQNLFMRNDGGIGGIVSVITDLSERNANDSENMAEMFRFVADNVGDLVAIVDAEGRRIYNNPSYQASLGQNVPIAGSLSFEQIHPDDRERVRAIFKETVAAGGGAHAQFRFLLEGENVRFIESHSRVCSGSGAAKRVLVVSKDVTDRLTTGARMRFLENYDALTELPNRALLKDKITELLSRRGATVGKLGVLLIDIDDFKKVNNTLGYAAGDELLRAVALRLNRATRPEDLIAREGGDEFIVVIPDARERSAVKSVVEKLLSVLSEPFVTGDTQIGLSACVGISVYPDDADDAESLLKNADIARYQAKAEGRSSYRFFTADMRQNARSRLTLEGSLHSALNNGEFELYYQPQIEIATGFVTGAEALLRWNHPHMGLLGPARFISLAEKSGLIIPLGEWLTEEACRQCKRGQDAGHEGLSIAVNVSGRQFRDADFVDKIARILTNTGLAPQSLELEITESMAMGQVDENINRLRALGVGFAIDDFGTGYASLSYLKRFNVDRLKIDRSFVRDLGLETNDAAIVRAILAMAKSLGLKVTAEGVETVEQLNFFSREGCDHAQGYLFAKALPAQEFEKFLIARRRVRAASDQARGACVA